MPFIRTTIGITYTLGKLVGGEQTVSFYHPALAVQPLWLNRVEPGAFGGQIARQYPHSVTPSLVLDLVVVLSHPFSNLFAHVPGSVIPHQHQYSFASLPQLMAAPLQETSGHTTYGPTIHEAQPHLSHIFFRQPTNQQAIASQRFGVCIAFGHFLLNQAHRLAFLAPTVHVRVGYSAPPYFVLKTKRPIWVRGRQSDQ